MFLLSTSAWVAWGSTLLLLGTGYQMVNSAYEGILSMDRFLAAQNALMREERTRIRARTHRWQFVKRRQEIKKLRIELSDILTPEEQTLDRAYNRQARGWSPLFIGALVLCIVSWTQLHA